MTTAPTTAVIITGPVLLYDGDCGLCNRVVRLMLRLDRHRLLRFAPLQGPNAQAYLVAQALPIKDFDSLVFVPAWERRAQPEFRLRTDGVIAALRACGGVASILASFFSWWPRRWRDDIYRRVARWRYRIFGAWRPKPLAHPEWAARFLD